MSSSPAASLAEALQNHTAWNNKVAFVHIYPAQAVVTAPKFSGITLSNGQITIQWTGNANLQSADKVTGPYTNVANAASPYKATATGRAKFYRLLQQ